MIADTIFEFIKDRKLDDLTQYLNDIDPVLVLTLPQLIDKKDGGKNLLHKCAQMKSDLMLETIIEKYRSTYVSQMIEYHESSTIEGVQS